MNIYEKAFQIAEREHAGQTRKDRTTPYFSHPKAVTAKVKAKLIAGFTKMGLDIDVLAGYTHVYLAVAILHDVLEDCPSIDAAQIEFELSSYAPKVQVNGVMVALKLLTKKKGASYYEYVERIKTNPIATFVKLCDLEHNMSDLEEGNLLDKYKFAHYFLSN